MNSGDHIGPYEITREIGRGGMGVVYLARDTKLDRDVAIKCLPDDLAQDEERLHRFEREAKLLASLNHPNIASIYGLEEVDGRRYLVLEYVDGETLEQRLTGGAIPVDEALAVAVQIAEAVEAAHEKGIIHRDLKPANIKFTSTHDGDDQQVKVLDFGLAKAFDHGADSDIDPSESPTIVPTHTPTMPGVILGTAAYMSPEQARGRKVDKRTDIWSFGVILYEMLTGTSPFAGESANDSIGAVLHKDIDHGGLPRETPAGVTRVLARCVERDRNLRYRDIGDVRIELAAARQGSVDEQVSRGGVQSVLVLSLLAVIAALLVGVVFLVTRPQPERPEIRRSVLPMPGETNGALSMPKISPDGRAVVFVNDGSLWLQDLSEFEPRRLGGTDGGSMPFWSPDSHWIGFGQGLRLMKISVSGGVPQQIATLPGVMAQASGAAWLADGTIVLTTGGTSLLSVSSLGGTLSEWLAIDPANEVDFHDASALPNGRGVLFTVHAREGGWWIGASDGTRRTEVIAPGDTQPATPAYAEPGFVLYNRDGSNPGVWAVPFSLKRLEATGEPFLVAGGAAYASGSDNGMLAYHRGTAESELIMGWVPIDGSAIVPVSEPVPQLSVEDINPDGDRLVYWGGTSNDFAIWVQDLTTGSKTRITSGEPTVVHAKWTSDGSAIAAVDLSVDPARIKFYATDGSGLMENSIEGHGVEFSPDGTLAVLNRYGEGKRHTDLWLRSLDEGEEERPLIATPADETEPNISPDGKWLLYTSNEYGVEQVYLTRFPSGQGNWQISTDGGRYGSWSPGSDRIYFVNTAVILVDVEFDTTNGVRLGTPVERISLNERGLVWFRGLITDADEDRILAVFEGDPSGAEAGIGVVENWIEEFREREGQ